MTDTGPNGQAMEIVVLLAERDTNTEQENVLDRNMEEKIVKETTKKLCTARPKYTVQLTDTGLNGQTMEIVVLLVETDTNTEQENVLDRNTEEMIVKETTKKLCTARPKYIAQLTDTGLNGQIMEIVVLLVEMDTNTEQENVLDRNMEEMIVKETTKKLCTARPKYTAQLTDTGLNGQIMEIVV